MQSAETVTGILRARGRRGLPCDELYRQLFNPALFLMAWGRIYANKGAMTAGINAETADGMSLAKIGRIINALRHERYRFQPVKRVHIPKKSGGTRPLGLPSWSDKLVGEVVRILLEAYYEPRFSPSSHGFRPGRGCHTALTEVEETWKGTTWFIEGDIRDCFGSLDHDVMIAVLAEHICDNRFLRLIRGMLRAGYLEDWRWNATLSGAPQGGVVSPILSNIYLDRMDKWAETVLIPEHTRGTGRKANPARKKMANAVTAARKREDRAAVRDLRIRARGMPVRDPHDPGYRRLRYIRYADLCRARHKSAYADARVMPTGLLEGLPGGQVCRRGGGITRRVVAVARGCRGTRAGCPAAGSGRGWCRAAGRGRGPAP